MSSAKSFDKLETLNKHQESLDLSAEMNLWGAVLCQGITEALRGNLSALLWILDEQEHQQQQIGAFTWITEGLFGLDASYLKKCIFNGHRTTAKNALKNFRNHYTKAYNRKPIK